MEKKYINENVSHATQKSDTNVSFSHNSERPLTRRLDEVRRYYNKGVISANSLALKLKVSKRSAERYLKRLKELGLAEIDATQKGGDLRHSDTKTRGKSSLINVHAQRWKVFVHYKGTSYRKSPFVFIDSFPDGLGGFVSVSCQDDYILLRCKGQKFWGKSEEDALWSSLDFWHNILLRLENRLNVVILKAGSFVMTPSYYEFETSESVVCRDAAERGEMMRVFHKDGKLRATTDMSDGFCHETHRVKSGMRDSESWNDHVNYVMDTPFSMEMMAKSIQFIVKAQVMSEKTMHTLAEGMAALVALMSRREK